MTVHVLTYYFVSIVEENEEFSTSDEEEVNDNIAEMNRVKPPKILKVPIGCQPSNEVTYDGEKKQQGKPPHHHISNGDEVSSLSGAHNNNEVTLLKAKLDRITAKNALLKSKLYEKRKENYGSTISLSSLCSTVEGLFYHRDEALKSELKSFVSSNVFPSCKFPISIEYCKALCIKAVRQGDVMLPPGTTDAQFAEIYHNQIH